MSALGFHLSVTKTKETNTQITHTHRRNSLWWGEYYKEFTHCLVVEKREKGNNEKEKEEKEKDEKE